MKKKIAVCANGWNYDSLAASLEGMKRYAQKEDFDIVTFLSFASYSEHTALMEGELNIYKLMTPQDYDGIIVFSTALNSIETAVNVCNRAKDSNVPVVSVGLEVEGIDSVCVSNEEGMSALVTHLVEEHNVKNVMFIGGTPDHIDSISRLETTKKVLADHGVSLPEDHIRYGRWANRHTVGVVDDIINDFGLPDVFICANDVMAMSACTELENLGYDVPGDVIVTGFDGAAEAKFFYPALTTVRQNYEEIGYRCCELIYEQIAGRKEVKKDIVPSSFVCGESCGCKGDIDYEKIRIEYCRRSFQRNTDAKLLEQSERSVRQLISECSSYKEMQDSLSDHYRRDHQFEGDGFSIVIDAEYYDDVMVSEKELWDRGLRKGVETIVCLKHGEPVRDAFAWERGIIPAYEKVPGEQHVYYLMPLHYFESNYGYLVLQDEPYIMKENMLYPYLEKLQQSLKLMRINLRLMNLYDKDQMTGLFNRFGYEEKAIKLYEGSLESKTPLMVMFVDINYMKRINDEFGHLHGDNAIKTVVEAIKENAVKDGIAVRFGGDEFLIIDPVSGVDEAAAAKQAILDHLAKINEEHNVPYTLSVSIGFVVSDPVNRPDAVLQDYIREADKLMYEIKKEMHTKDRRQR